MGKSFVQFFGSVKLAIVLIIIIILASTLGTLIPQDRTPQEYVQHYGQLSGLLMRFQLTKLYHSTWYIALLGFLALNIIVCTLNRLSPKLRKTVRPQVGSQAKDLLGLKVNARFKKTETIEQAGDNVRRELRARRYRLRARDEKGKIFFLGRKKTLGWFGPDVVHLGLLIILAGGIISGLGGFRTNLSFRENQTLGVPQADFALRLDKFETEYYPNGSIRDWKSTLTVLENGRTVTSKVVEVNHPLSYKGIVFYQSSYGWDSENPVLELWVTKMNDPAFFKKFDLRPGQALPLDPTGGTVLTLRRFVPDFIIGENREVSTRSRELNNPAALVEITRGETPLYSGWTFAHYPDFTGMHSGPETDLNVTFKTVRSNVSVIEAARDPGANFIWAGSAVFMLGLFLAFYWPTREIRFVLEEAGEKTEIVAAGISHKARESLTVEFESVMAALRSQK